MTSAVRSLPPKTFLRRCCSLALPLVLLAGSLQPALAQSVDDQLQRLQRELSDLQRQVYAGETPPAIVTAAYQAAGKPSAVTAFDGPASKRESAAAEWITK